MRPDWIAALRDLMFLDRPPVPWSGNSVMFHPAAGGAVEASSRGVFAVGRDEGEALSRLGELLDWWPAPADAAADETAFDTPTASAPPAPADPPPAMWMPVGHGRR
jgi:hypothetical protein